MASNKSDFIDFSGLIRQYLSKWWLFLISFIVCVGLAALFIYVHKPKFAVGPMFLSVRMKPKVLLHPRH